MAIISSYPDDSATTSNDKFLTLDSSGATKNTPASTLKNFILQNGAITNDMLGTTSTDPGGAWVSWTPTWSNMTIGNGTVTARYKVVGKTVFCRIKFKLGSTSVYGTIPTFTLPVNANSFYATDNTLVGVGYAEDAGVSSSNIGFQLSSATVCTLVAMKTDGTYGSWVGSAANAPFNWGNADYFSGQFIYEAA